MVCYTRTGTIFQLIIEYFVVKQPLRAWQGCRRPSAESRFKVVTLCMFTESTQIPEIGRFLK